MNKLLLILFAMLPFTLSAQFTVRAYRTTDNYKRKVVRIGITNTSDFDLLIYNTTEVTNGTSLYFSPTKKIEDSGGSFPFSFFPDPFESKLSKIVNVIIEKGEIKKADYDLDYIGEFIPIDKKIYLLGYIDYFLLKDRKIIQHRKLRSIEIEVE